MPEEGSHIRTPDQRLRVFVSSTLHELLEERRAARAAIEALHLTPVMFELGARPHPPRALYRAYLEQSDVFVGIYWQRYGWVAPGEQISGLEDEFRLSGDRPKLLYLKTPATEREPRLNDLVAQIQAEDKASYRAFSRAQELQRLLADDLSLLLTERFAASEERMAVEANADARLTQPPPLPVPPTLLIGRSQEVREARALLMRDDVRLMTLLGPGGIGKTRLALEIAAQAAPDFGGAVYFVNLAAVRDPHLLLPTVAAALGLRNDQVTLETLRARIGQGRLLIVLDNFEQLLPAAMQLVEWLALAPGLKLLVTSRAALRVTAEHEYLVLPLGVSESSELKPLRASEAAQLFVARAQAVKPDFDLDAQNAAAVWEIVHRLDGLPLAIELAAAYIRLLSPEALLARLPSALDAMRGARDLPERQRTLRATLDWSHDLLNPSEQALFARLGALMGGGTLEAIEALCPGAGEDDPVVLLEGLLDHSLLRFEDDRFVMLEVVREYALERLQASGQLEDVFALHREYYATHAERVAVDLRGSRQLQALEQLDREEANLRAVCDRALERHDAATVGRINWALSLYWMVRAKFKEAERLVESALKLQPAPDATTRTRLLTLWGALASWLARYEVAVKRLEQSLESAANADDPEATMLALIVLGLSLDGLGRMDEATERLERALEVSRQRGEIWSETFVLARLGQNAIGKGNLERAAALFDQSLSLARQFKLHMSEVIALQSSVFLLLRRGDVRGAATRLRRARQLSLELHYLDALAWDIEASAGVAFKRGENELGVRLFGAAEGQRLAMGSRTWMEVRNALADDLEVARTRLGDERFEQIRREGAALRLEQALQISEDLLAHALSEEWV